MQILTLIFLKGALNNPLFWAAHNGNVLIVQILLEKGANIEFVSQVHLNSFLLIFFVLSHYLFFYRRWGSLLSILLLKMGGEKLFKFYWKEEQMLIFSVRFS